MVEHTPHPLVVPYPHGLTWRRAARRHHATSPEAHQELVAFLGLSGQASYMVDGVIHTLREGVLLWALSGQKHFLLSETAGFDMRVVLVARAAYAPGVDLPPLALSETGAGLPPRRLTTAGMAELEQIADAQAQCQQDMARAAGLRWWLARAWALWHAAPEGAGRLVHPAVERAARLWQDAPERALTDVAQEAGLSPGRLGRLFRAQTGQSVTAYRTGQKLARFAALKAAQPRLSLTTLALDAGFGSYAQFYRAWMAQHGTPPRAGQA